MKYHLVVIDTHGERHQTAEEETDETLEWVHDRVKDLVACHSALAVETVDGDRFVLPTTSIVRVLVVPGDSE